MARRVPIPAVKPAFLITIDTEGDDAWTAARPVTTRNAAYLPRFQDLCEEFAMRPTYLVNWEMAHDDAFGDLGRRVIGEGTGEVGMHLHAWSSPPLEHHLSTDDARHQPYLYEYPRAVMSEKIAVMTAALQDAFGVAMVSHRAGRWGLDGRYARLLAENGYQVDCSVTPRWSWSRARGVGATGPDFRHFPDDPYLLDLDDISRPGDSSLLELPMTIVGPSHGTAAAALLAGARRLPLLGPQLDGLLPATRWLRPFGPQPDGVLAGVLRQARDEGRSHVELMLHSSELMPGGSPYFRDAMSVERLFANLRELFEAAGELEPMTLAECRSAVVTT